MASVLITALLLVLKTSKASPVSSHQHSYGSCKQFTIPVTATADSAIYDYPTVDSDIEAGAWAIYEDTWDTPKGPLRVVKNTTTSGTYNIHAQLCIPNTPAYGKNILQIATHGVHYDSRYWDPELDRENLSYVEASLKEGYAILTYDRLGVGRSDQPDAYNTVQAPLELEILRQLTLMARNGTLYDLAEKTKPANAAFHGLETPAKIVHVGHSFGSFLTSAFIAKYGDLTDGAVITGFVLNKYLGKCGMAAFAVEFAGRAPYNRPSGYVVATKPGIQNIFFAGNTNTAYTQEMFDYGYSLRQPVPLGEFASAFNIIGLQGPSFKGPVQYMLAEQDFYICGGDCKNLPEADPKALRTFYPNAAAIEVYVHPNTGHAFTLHNNATAGYQVTFDFFSRNGL